MESFPSIFVIIPAGGSGERFGGDQKKQFLTLGEKSLLEICVEKFLSFSNNLHVIISLPESDLGFWSEKLQDERVRCVVGGKTRAESVKNGFLAITNAKPEDLVLVHDAARPLLSHDLITRVLEGVKEHGAVLPVLPVFDTVKSVDPKTDQVLDTVNRESLRLAQTPQASDYQSFEKAYEMMGDKFSEFTDEAMLLEASGKKVFCVEGEKRNIKITRPEDLDLAKFYYGDIHKE
jgi:2-C-methyl-D-erythritol 4-phosphate cytidylyltransferase